MKVRYSVLIAIVFIASVWASSSRGQIPPDTTTYWLTNWTGIPTAMHRPPDSTMVQGQLLIRFRKGALDTTKLLDTYLDWYNPNSTHTKGSHPLSSPFPNDTRDQRGFAYDLRSQLLTERFYLDSASNVVTSTALKNFLKSAGGRYLKRLTTASPYDTLSVTRNNDTIPCDVYEWMVLYTDSTTNPLIIAYFLTTQYGHDVTFATPNYQGGKLLGHVPGDGGYTCEKGFQSMIGAEAAWDYEWGLPNIRVALWDGAVDWRHPDLGAAMGKTQHVSWGWNWIRNDSIVERGWLIGNHGTQTAGIVGALTNRNANSVAGIAGGWGTLFTGTDAIERGQGASLIINAVGYWDGGGVHIGTYLSTFMAAMFESSSHSPVTMFGLAAHSFICAAIFPGGEIYPAQSAIAYAHENGVVFVAADDQQGGAGINQQDYPAGWDEPWVISVAGSVPVPSLASPTKVFQSDYGYTLDLLAPSGDEQSCTNPYTLNWTTMPGDSAGTLGSFGYNSFAGNSAAVPNVAGSAALLLSHYERQDSVFLKHIEPEDIAGILKASAWRGDADRNMNNCLDCWRPISGWGHLSIGNAFTMIYSGYELRHFGLTGNAAVDHAKDSIVLWDTLIKGQWDTLPGRGYNFYVPYKTGAPSIMKYKERNYLLDTNNNLYHGFYRIDTIIVKLDSIWDINTPLNKKLYAWGRGGGMNDKSGWSFAQSNQQMGWSRVVSGIGGDSLNEGIFHSHSRTFKIITVQYQPWTFEPHHIGDTSRAYFFGHVPLDSMMGVNFTVFGKVWPQYSAVRNAPQMTSDQMRISLDMEQRMATARFYTQLPEEGMIIEIYDVLGRLITRTNIRSVESGWNTVQLPLSNISSGTYICRISGARFVQSRSFSIVR